MEMLAQELKNEIDRICGGYHYCKDENVVEKAEKLAGKIQMFCNTFLQGNIFEIEEVEYQGFLGYVIQVLEDYLEAVQRRDSVLMLDTLDYGLRELLDIYCREEKGEGGNE